MSDDTIIEFDGLSFEEKIVAVDRRLNKVSNEVTGRIRTPHELVPLQGQTIYLIISPHTTEKDIANCILLEWKVGTVQDHRGKLVEAGVPLSFENDEKYICLGGDNPDHIISLKDFNVVPNSYNNNAAFSTKDAAEAYSVYRKMMYPMDPNIAELASFDADQTFYFFRRTDVERLIEAENQQ